MVSLVDLFLFLYKSRIQFTLKLIINLELKFSKKCTDHLQTITEAPIHPIQA